MSRMGRHVFELQEEEDKNQPGLRGNEDEYIYGDIRRIRVGKDSKSTPSESSGHAANPGCEKAPAIPR